jgi:monooxygenase
MYMYRLARKYPDKAKERIADMAREHLGPDYDIATHFSPSYNPWDQRLCLVPDADLFASLRAGTSEVVTDRIARFTPTGLLLESGKELAADIVVAATGLELQLLNDIPLSVDGKPLVLAEHTAYKAMMLSDVPNLALSFGYTNASWTLKADLTSEYVCRVLNTMRKRKMRQATPRIASPVDAAPFLDFTSGYVQRAMERFPRQGTRKPWRVDQNYTRDLLALRFGSVDTEMEFSNPVPRKKRAA